jgi:ribosomal-protein-alanine N-acetyltransferase
VIRHARPVDEPALTSLQSYLREPSPRLLRAALASDTPSPVEALVSTSAGGDRDAADDIAGERRDGDQPVGYLLAVPGDGSVYVAELVVHPEARREGRATALLSACAAEADRLTVTVAPDNEPARSLYRRCGFEKTRRLPDFFADGAAIRYRRSTDDG